MPGRPRRPRTRWLGIISNLRPSQDLIPGPVVAMWSLAAELDADAGLTAWWRPAPYDRLELRPTHFDVTPPFQDAGTVLLLGQVSAAERALRADDAFERADRDAAHLPGWYRPLLRQDVHRMLETAGGHLGLGPPPLPGGDLGEGAR